MRRHGATQRGFTLVELMITLVLAAILAALAVPTLQQTIQNGNARSAAREVANHLRMARDKAMSRGEVVYAVVTPGDPGSVELRATENAQSSCRLATADDGNTRNVRTYELGESGQVSIQGTSEDGAQWICFSPTGEVLDGEGNVFDSCAGGGTFRVWLSRDEPTDRQTSCNPEDRTKQRNFRYLNLFWVVEVPYNGGIQAKQ